MTSIQPHDGSYRRLCNSVRMMNVEFRIPPWFTVGPYMASRMPYRNDSMRQSQDDGFLALTAYRSL